MLNNHHTIIHVIDVVHVYGIPFLTTIFRVVKLGSETKLSNTKDETIVKALLVIINTYEARGFRVLLVAVDYAFEAIRTN